MHRRARGRFGRKLTEQLRRRIATRPSAAGRAGDGRRDLLKSVDRQKVDRILANAEKVSNDLAASSGEISKIVASADTAMIGIVRPAARIAVVAASPSTSGM